MRGRNSGMSSSWKSGALRGRPHVASADLAISAARRHRTQWWAPVLAEDQGDAEGRGQTKQLYPGKRGHVPFKCQASRSNERGKDVQDHGPGNQSPELGRSTAGGVVDLPLKPVIAANSPVLPRFGPRPLGRRAGG